MVARVVILLLAFASGCHNSKPHIHCTDPSQCTLQGRIGYCIAGSCATPDPTCASGYRYDTTAGGSGDCVPPSSFPDMAGVDGGGVNGSSGLHGTIDPVGATLTGSSHVIKRGSLTISTSACGNSHCIRGGLVP